MDPLLKWPGGKRRIAALIADKLAPSLAQGGRYVELFAGGAAVFFHLEPKEAVLVDVCKPLISFYEAIKREPDAVSEELLRLTHLPLNEDTYLKIRGEWSGNDFGVKFAARFLYLNRTGFNGLFRLNKDKGYNVAWGKKEKMPFFPSPEDVSKASSLLKTTKLYSKDYSRVLRATHSGDVLYGDPPYWETYDRYNGDGFNEADHRRLAKSLSRAAKRGVSVFVSNIDCEGVRKAYEWATIDVVPVRHKISCTSEGRKTVDEVIAWVVPPFSDHRQIDMFG